MFVTHKQNQNNKNDVQMNGFGPQSVNPALQFNREQCKGLRLDITAGTAVRFEPGQQRTVALVPFGGNRTIYGFRAAIMGSLEEEDGQN